MNTNPLLPRLIESERLITGTPEGWRDREGPLSGFFGEDLAVAPWTPPLDFTRDATQYTVLMDLPGVKKSEIHLDFNDGILYIYGSREHEPEVRSEESIHFVLERRCGHFMRHVHLDAGIVPEEIRAEYKRGILKVSIPRDEKATAKNVSIKVN